MFANKMNKMNDQMSKSQKRRDRGSMFLRHRCYLLALASTCPPPICFMAADLGDGGGSSQSERTARMTRQQGRLQTCAASARDSDVRAHVGY